MYNNNIHMKRLAYLFVRCEDFSTHLKSACSSQKIYFFTTLYYVVCAILLKLFILKKIICLKINKITTLCGGSLGSRVDEERSKLRELM